MRCGRERATGGFDRGSECLAIRAVRKDAHASVLSAQKFTAVWNGDLSVDLRSDYSFQAELNGELQLEINGATVLELSGDGNESTPSRPVRLNKGTNMLTATFRSPAQGDAFVRLFWFNKETPRGPTPLAALTHATENVDLQRAEKRRFGRELFIEYNCHKCHVVPRLRFRPARDVDGRAVV